VDEGWLRGRIVEVVGKVEEVEVDSQSLFQLQYLSRYQLAAMGESNGFTFSTG